MRVVLAAFMTWVACGLVGCSQNPFRTAQAERAATPFQSQIADLRSHRTELNANNEELHARLAEMERQVRLLDKERGLLKDRLKQMAGQLQETQLARKEVEQRMEGLQASTRLRGGASFSANNSLRNALREVQIKGLEVRREQDVIRIVIPSDQVFQAGGVDFTRGADQALAEAADAIARNYRAQRVVIEAHTDDSPQPGGATPHQLTASQALAVLDRLVRIGRLNEKQFSMHSQGANHPRASNATAAGRAKNRRIELVVYPERWADMRR